MALEARVLLVLPGKLDLWRYYNDQVNGPRRQEFEDMLHRHGFSKWMVWHQSTKVGELLIGLQETTENAGGMRTIAQSDHPFDLWFKDQVKGFTGFDLNKPLSGSPPELALQFP